MARGSSESKALLSLSIALVAAAGIAGAVLAPPAGSTALSQYGGGTGFEAVAAPALLPHPTTSAVRFHGLNVPALHGRSNIRPGVWGWSNQGWGGYFESVNGYGIRVVTTATEHWKHGGFFEAQGGYGILAQSASNQGVRGEAGDVSEISQPVGAVGIVGLGSNRGTYGASSGGIGVYGVSDSNYGVWGQSSTGRGVTGRTSRQDNNYGLYTPDNLFAANMSTSGAVSMVMQNGGHEPLEPGDVVVFAGIRPPLEPGGSPIVRVARADTFETREIAGVVQTRFNAEVIRSSFELELEAALQKARDQGDQAAIETIRRQAEPTRAGPVPSGEFLLVVVKGTARVKASAIGVGAIDPGSSLAIGTYPGIATLGAMVPEENEVLASNRVLGTALESLTVGEDLIYVFVK